MPIYEYRCRQCGQPFEKLVRVTTPLEEVECPHCGQRDAERRLSLFASFGAGAAACSPSSGAGGGGFR
ncbi:MAG: zinc ribbon domain-containing protein [Myxococcota bacterium]|jgi:putative FmdB family regulatory protein|nr:zinc ribbon domain-containing protein [Myxococcota bacterium]